MPDGYCPEECCGPYLCGGDCCLGGCCDEFCCEEGCAQCCDTDSIGCCDPAADPPSSSPCFNHWCDYLFENSDAYKNTCFHCSDIFIDRYTCNPTIVSGCSGDSLGIADIIGTNTCCGDSGCASDCSDCCSGGDTCCSDCCATDCGSGCSYDCYWNGQFDCYDYWCDPNNDASCYTSGYAAACDPVDEESCYNIGHTQGCQDCTCENDCGGLGCCDDSCCPDTCCSPSLSLDYYLAGYVDGYQTGLLEACDNGYCADCAT